MTIPQFAASLARQALSKHLAPTSLAAAKAARSQRLIALEHVLGGMPKVTDLALRVVTADDGRSQTLTGESEPGMPFRLQRDHRAKPTKLVVLLDLDAPIEQTFSGESAAKLRSEGWAVVVPELRATGRTAPVGDKIGHAPDHNSAEWSLWIGRPLLGQWVWDVRRTLDALHEQDGSLPHELQVCGSGSAGVIALCAAALDERISHAMTLNSLASYVTDEPYRGQRLGLMAPGILRDVGDIAHLAALVAPRAVTISSGVTGSGKPLNSQSLNEHFAISRAAFIQYEASASLKIAVPE